MIERYSRKFMRDLWTEENKFNAYLKVEILATSAWCKLGVVPKEDYVKIRDNARFDVKRIAEIEEQTRHDVVAFTRAVGETLGDEKKWIHYGLTSTDVVDTANGYLLKQVNDVLYDDLIQFREVLRQKALMYKDLPCIGRTHGVHADITSFGLKWALWFEEITRNITRFELARCDVEAGKISGAVGNFANTPMFVQDDVCAELGISSANISTQVLQRDRHAHYLSVLALIAVNIEKIATEIRHLQRTEVFEAEEPFNKGQKGSSAMPHKRNPIVSENMCGCARVMKGYMMSFYDNVPLWHERDISHSCTERIILPDATELLDYMLNRYRKVLENLVVYPKNMEKNIYLTNKVIFAQRVMTSLIDKGMTREAAYDLVQPMAMDSFLNGLDYKILLENNPIVKEKLTASELDACFTLEYYLKNVDAIYQRVKI